MSGERQKIEMVLPVGHWGEVEAAKSGAKLRRFELVAYTGGKMWVGLWNHPVVMDLQGLDVGDKSRPILKEHHRDQVVGHTDSIRVEGNKLLVSGVISGVGQAAKEVIDTSKNGFPWQASIGAIADVVEFVPVGDRVTVNGSSFEGPLYVSRKASLYEVSFVVLGADDNTTAKVAAKEGKNMKTKPQTEPANEPENTDPIRAERERVSAILDWAKDHPAIQAKAVNEGWTVEATKAAVLEAVRAARPKPPRMSFAADGLGGGSSPRQVLAAATLMHAGHRAVAEKHFGAPTCQAAEALRARTLLDLCERALYLAGQDIPSGGPDRLIRAALSNSDLPVALGDAASKEALASYEEHTGSWKAFAKVASVRDFKTHNLARVLFGGEFEEVGPGGELKHGNLAEESYTAKVDTYGEMLTISRKDIINDDMHALMDVARALGRAGARLTNDQVYSAILANKEPNGATDFFSSARGNYLSGAGSVLSIDGLTSAVSAMTSRVDSQGRNIDVMPRTLVVPPELDPLARTLLNSQILERFVDESTDFQPTGNPHAGRLNLVVEPRLSNSARFSGTSTTSWYLFSKPEDGAVVVAFLNGQESPTIEEVPTAPEILGLSWRGFLDCGVSLADWRGAQKSAGA